jgi:hypothetical protein
MDAVDKVLLGTRAMKNHHVGFCFGKYDLLICHTCPSEGDCLRLFLKEYCKEEREGL